MIYWARPLVACQANSVNRHCGLQNGHARLCVRGSIFTDRPLFSVFKLPLRLSGSLSHGERLTSKVRISVGAAFNCEENMWTTQCG
ncbi:hypothetical protein Y032_0260g525 [Ancylostoma ceylanicum]|uniref:Uncharacterized protein n=1 Tax=Ancylostoma ceylanicum TaxID=53326 RepID=A0A016SB22_9BILA|nr:hypothetical protein Y032_0260g525 [Ancylostoma ceylanicum]